MTQLRVGLVGSGGITRAHVPAWQALGAHITVFSLVGAQELATQYQLTVVETLQELLDSCDVVDICTPTASHRDIAVLAAAAGKHIMCEKPLGRTVAEGREIQAAVAAAGTQLYPGHVVRFFPAYVAAKEAVDAGRLGRLAVLRFSRGGAGPTADWFYDQDASGGIIMDQMIHDLDQALWLAGDVDTVYAVQHQRTYLDDGVARHSVSAHITLTHSTGAISHVQGVWGPPTMVFGSAFELAGDAGVLSHNSTADGSLVQELSTRAPASYLPPRTRQESPYLTEIREFADAFTHGGSSRVSLDDGLVAVALAEAALASLRSGAPVPFSVADILTPEGTTR